MHESRESEKGVPCDGVDTETSQSVQCWCDRAGPPTASCSRMVPSPSSGFENGFADNEASFGPAAFDCRRIRVRRNTDSIRT